MLFIGICGASGSGKSTLAEELATMVNKSILIINQDAYYKDHPDLSFEERCLLNYDEPSITISCLKMCRICWKAGAFPKSATIIRTIAAQTCRANIWSRTTSSSSRASMRFTTRAFAR